jgi:hypothetical protein
VLWQTERLASKKWVFALLVAGIIAATAVTFLGAVGGSWYESGDDMRHILPELEHGSPTDWLTGPWVGKRMFEYYRPVTSIAMWAQYQAFGERQSAWQMVSLLSHLSSVALLALLLRTLFGASLPALCGTAIWAFRGRTLETIEWVPAQTDLYAGLFSLAALLLFVLWLRGGRHLVVGVAIVLWLLAVGSKEVALVVPGVAGAIALFEEGQSAKTKALIVASCAAVAVLFVAVRLAMLGGTGFLPGQAVGDSVRTGGIRPDSVVRNLLGFLLPASLAPISPLCWKAAWSAAVGALGTWLLGRKRWIYGVAAAAATFLLITHFLGDPGFWLVPQTGLSIIKAIIPIGLAALVVSRLPKKAGMAALVGLILSLPLYHVVYNKAGNVRYLPDIYWAIVWCLVGSAILAGKPIGDTRS